MRVLGHRRINIIVTDRLRRLERRIIMVPRIITLVRHHMDLRLITLGRHPIGARIMDDVDHVDLIVVGDVGFHLDRRPHMLDRVQRKSTWHSRKPFVAV